MYADESGLRACKQCADGFRGVVLSTSDSTMNASAAHVACDDDKCERPSQVPANAVFIAAECPDHGEHSGDSASECALSCGEGYYSSGAYVPFRCEPDAGSVRASYQGGTITCLRHSNCGIGEFTKVAGSTSSQPVCEACRVGFFKAVVSVTSMSTDVCTAHATCTAGEWTQAVGTNSSDAQCDVCSAGRFRASAPNSTAAPEEEAVVCKTHKTCLAGQWTARAGNSTTDTECLACGNGRFRVSAPTSKAREVSEAEACSGVHKTCSAGEWTEAAGTSARDTQCAGRVVNVQSRCHCVMLLIFVYEDFYCLRMFIILTLSSLSTTCSLQRNEGHIISIGMRGITL